MKDFLYGVLCFSVFSCAISLAAIASHVHGIYTTLQNKPACVAPPTPSKSKGMV